MPYISDMFRLITVCDTVQFILHLVCTVYIKDEATVIRQMLFHLPEYLHHFLRALAVVQYVDSCTDDIECPVQFTIPHIIRAITEMLRPLLPGFCNHMLRLVECADVFILKHSAKISCPAPDVEQRAAPILKLVDDVEPERIWHVIRQFIIVPAELSVGCIRLQHAHHSGTDAQGYSNHVQVCGIHG